jgi:hypothetical protein
MFMLAQNVVNPEKKGKIEGSVFHIFYADLKTAFFFDRDFTIPIMWGNKTVVMTQVKALDKLMNVQNNVRVRIYSYILTTDGYRRIDTYNGPIETIGKYIRRY